MNRRNFVNPSQIERKIYKKREKNPGNYQQRGAG
jgi:hypothetical protein